MKVGFIGLGMIGGAMAEQLVKPGFDTSVYDVFPAALARFEGQAYLAASPADLGRRADLVGICVHNDEQVASVLTGENGLLETLPEGSIVAVHSTVRSSTVQSLAETAAARGVSVFDAAVSGGPMGARAHNLVCMVGGDPDVIARAKPLLESYSGKIIHAGGLGKGMALKASNNLVTYFELLAAVEGYRLAAALGLDQSLLSAVMTENTNLSTAMRLYIQHRTESPAKMGDEAYKKTQTSLAEVAEKDLDLALEMARQTGIKLPTTEAVRKLFRDIVTG
jgi:3-hydroxyisobutyrate dehydrogenase